MFGKACMNARQPGYASVVANDSAIGEALKITFQDAQARVAGLLTRSRDLRVRLAESASVVADEADILATMLEEAAGRGDAKRRLRLAAIGREIAGVERRNAARLLGSGDGPLRLEHMPDWGTSAPAPGPAGSDRLLGRPLSE
jgi:hypothetical protein